MMAAVQPFENSPAQRVPNPGEAVHVKGHGPAVFLEVCASLDSSDLVYKVRYPDGSQDAVAFKEVLVSEERRTTSGSRESITSPAQPRMVSPSCDSGVTPLNPFLMTSPRGPRQLEYLGRAFDDASRNIRAPSATFSLVATMVGGGVLSLPYAMSQCGLIFGTICLLAAAVGSAWTLEMLVECARATGRDSFELVGHAAYGEFSRKASIALVFAICWLTKIAYFVLMADLLVPFASLAAPDFSSAHSETTRRIVVTLAALLLSPMCFKSSLSSLRFMCFASVGSVMVVGLVVGYRAFQNLDKEHLVQITTADHGTRSVLVQASYNLWPADWGKALYAFPMFGVSFLCHFNALPTHQELQRPTRYRMRMIIVTTLTLTTVIYLFVSICGYLYGGCYTCGNILLNFKSDDSLVAVGRGALGLVLMLNFPLICQPCRNALFRLLVTSGICHVESSISDATDPAVSLQGNIDIDMREAPSISENAGVRLESPSQDSSRADATGARVHVYHRQDTRGGRGEDPSALQAFDTFMPKDETVQQSAMEPTLVQRCILTTILLASSLLVSCFMKSIMVVWSIIGSTVCFLIAFILPGLFWYKIVGLTAKPWRRNAAACLVGFITIMSFVCFVITCFNLNEPPCPTKGLPKEVQLWE